MKSLTVNGVEQQFAPEEMPGTVSDLLGRLNVGASVAVVEIDGEIVRPDAFAQTPLTEGQTIELVRFVGGG